MRRKKAKEQFIAVITLSSVFVFFIYLKTNPDISSTSLSSEIVEMKNLENAAEVKTDEEYIEDDKSITNTQEVGISESIIEYTDSELNRAKAYQNRNWKPDHTINTAAWEYVSRMSVVENKETLKEVFDMDKNQVVNAIK